MELLTIKETAAQLRLSVRTVRRMLHRDKLRGAFKAGCGRGDWRIPAETLERYIKHRAADAKAGRV